MNKKIKSIYIAGVPRSGTSWLGQIFNSSPSVKFVFQPLFSYEFKNIVNADSSAAEFNSFLDSIYHSNASFLKQSDKVNTKDYPVFKKKIESSHLAFKENNNQYVIEAIMRKVPQMILVGIIRNPNAVLNSWVKNIKEFPVGSDIIKEWRYGECKNQSREDFFGYYKWKEVSNLYLDLKQKWPNRVHILSYEELVDSPNKCAREMFDFCSIEYTQQTENFIDASTKSHSESPYAVFKSKKVATQWKNEFPAYITNEIKKDLSGTRLEKFLE
jgi:hypothetical protein